MSGSQQSEAFMCIWQCLLLACCPFASKAPKAVYFVALLPVFCLFSSHSHALSDICRADRGGGCCLFVSGLFCCVGCGMRGPVGPVLQRAVAQAIAMPRGGVTVVARLALTTKRRNLHHETDAD